MLSNPSNSTRMSPTPSPVAHSYRWDAESHLDIHTIESVLAQIKTGLHGAAQLTINLSEVTFIDTTGVQFLLVMLPDLKRRGIAFECIGRSRAVDRACEALGVNATVILGDLK